MRVTTQREIEILVGHVDRIARRDGARLLCMVFEEHPNIPIAVNGELPPEYQDLLKQGIVKVIIELRKRKFGDDEKRIILPN